MLLSIDEYRRLTGAGRSIADMLAMDEDFDFDPPKAVIQIRPAEFD